MTDLDLDALLDVLADKLSERVAARLSNGNGNGNGHAPEPDQLLTVDEAAQVLGVTPRWIYRHARTLPFTVRLPGRAVRFSEQGLARYVERRLKKGDP
jgi:excisionase family DNA binding protein